MNSDDYQFNELIDLIDCLKFVRSVSSLKKDYCFLLNNFETQIVSDIYDFCRVYYGDV